MQHASFNNYNGVMLCAQPSPPAPVLTTNKLTHSLPSTKERVINPNQEGSFNCGTVPKPWGTNVVIAEKARVLSRLSKNDGALSRHKKWLHEMQEKRKGQLRQKEEECRIKEVRKRHFMEKQAQKRAIAGEDESDDVITQENLKEDELFSFDISNTVMTDENQSRPAWALTETVEKKRQEGMETAEETELMDFVDDLDAEIFYEDMELRVLMSQIKQRICVLEKEKSLDESRLRTVMDTELAAYQRDKYNTTTEIDSDPNRRDIEYGDNDNAEDDIQSIAETVRSEGDASISSVHSRKSMEMLVTKSHDRIRSIVPRTKRRGYKRSGVNLPLQVNMEEGHTSEPCLLPPITITHTEDNGAILVEAKSLNKLPFKNRNPAI